MTHPLTDDICLALDDNPSIAYMCFDWKKSMRAAADWQLEQVMEWIEDNLGNEIYADSYEEDYGKLCGYILTHSVKNDLHLAMRPQENN